MSPKRIRSVTVRPSGPNSFAVVGSDGRIIRDGFSNSKVAWMWAAKQGLHKGHDKRKRETRAIPNDLVNDQIIGLPLLARLSNLSYDVFRQRAHAGEFGPLIQVNDRAYGLRFGSWKAAMTAREVIK
jgi:hypothetical protein